MPFASGAFGERLKGRERVIPPKSPLGEATAHCRNNWATPTVYASDGELSIANNPAERMLRPVAAGRKNRRFFGSDKGGETAANRRSVAAPRRTRHMRRRCRGAFFVPPERRKGAARPRKPRRPACPAAVRRAGRAGGAGLSQDIEKAEETENAGGGRPQK
jgi:hypothetical protein